ncbi:adenylate/guanylate cyclase domain-containing protein [Marinifilum sp. N1E240]|uniref:adenylate/guanylate cyclase domain-containing protein n=1 Tax=Marinifilum sp. N1E240 TaxID=2608082 RepID=UPI001D048FC9|nr:adenylate/guanylate cyclase domain-containing protein [Marinifilum sp. N1E240]
MPKYIRYIIRYFFISIIAFAFWTILREYGQEVIFNHETLGLWEEIRFHLIISAIASVIWASQDYYIEKKILKKVSFGKTILIYIFSYLLTIIFLISFAIRLTTRILDSEFNLQVYSSRILEDDMLLLTVYWFIVIFISIFIKEIDKKLGPGNLWKFLGGKFYSPVEESKIFMFLDLKSSTPIAEEIGHIQYSKFIQDCFQDLDVVTKYKAEIYQYVGDMVVLTWPIKIGLHNSNCLKTFFAFKAALNNKSGYYKNTYGHIPEFKAGLNMGKIVAAEVGNIKTEIAYHGDVINTAARIQGECSRLNIDILISENIQDSLIHDPSLKFEEIEKIQLKGKQELTNLYTVTLM